jgi:hypothetical protein
MASEPEQDALINSAAKVSQQALRISVSVQWQTSHSDLPVSLAQ